MEGMKDLTLSRPAAASIALLFIVLLGVGAYGGYRYKQFEASSSSAIAKLTSALAEASSTNADLNAALISEQNRNNDFESQIDKLTGSVGTLTKIANTDPQLLAKYSKIYFLNENYIPSSLSDIPEKDTADESRTYEFLTPVLPHLKDLLDDARDDDVDLLVASSYRSFADQATLKGEYVTTYGSGANTFSAEQGYSEHELGTTVDFTTKALGGGLDGFDGTPAYAWLTDNAYKYGFILSYPKGNVFYQYEPWHWRYVGVDLAKRLHKDDENFYDLDQRTIDDYLADFFD
jgi:LAS superfamily LD-carboxypeptidase LdcB